jgi:hypothetical protein
MKEPVKPKIIAKISNKEFMKLSIEQRRKTLAEQVKILTQPVAPEMVRYPCGCSACDMPNASPDTGHPYDQSDLDDSKPEGIKLTFQKQYVCPPNKPTDMSCKEINNKGCSECIHEWLEAEANLRLDEIRAKDKAKIGILESRLAVSSENNEILANRVQSFKDRVEELEEKLAKTPTVKQIAKLIPDPDCTDDCERTCDNCDYILEDHPGKLCQRQLEIASAILALFKGE